MPIALEIDSRKFVKALNSIPRKEKIFIVDSIEKNLLAEWDKYEESEEVKNRISEALIEYQNGDFVNLKELI